MRVRSAPLFPPLARTGSEPIFRAPITKCVSEPSFAQAGAVYLTFDDGPDPEWTGRVLDVLAAARVRATFFVVGRAARAAPGLVRRIASEGHEIGNHSLSHRHPWRLREAAAREEVRGGAAAIAETLGRAPRWFRPPHGRMRRCMIDEAERSGQRTVLWSVSAIDWGPLGRADEIAERLARVEAGDIVLMHDGRNKHNKPGELLHVLPSFLAQLKAKRSTPALLSSIKPQLEALW